MPLTHRTSSRPAAWLCAASFLVCFLGPAIVFAQDNTSASPEPVPAPPPSASQTPPPSPRDASCPISYTPPSRPWYYWWDSWCWWDRIHDRGPHQPYLPPASGSYYFRPHSLIQLRAQQAAAAAWGADPRNPYAQGILPENRHKYRVQSDVDTAAAHPSGDTSPGKSTQVAKAVPAGGEVIPWPKTLRDSRFAELRAAVEAPYRRQPDGEAEPTAADYRAISDAARKMAVALRHMAVEIPTADYLAASAFVNQLDSEAWGQMTRVAPAKFPASRSESELVIYSSTPSAETLAGPSLGPAAPTAIAAEPPAEASTDVIPWPPALCDKRFAAQRAAIEAPFRRPNAESGPTVAEYRSIADAARQMALGLRRMGPEVPAAEYLNAVAFVNQMDAEATKHFVKEAPANRPMPAAPDAELVVYTSPKPSEPQPAPSVGPVVPAVPQAAEPTTDIIKWPTTLLDRRFAVERAVVEAPYRAQANGQGGPTAEDYRRIGEAARKMALILRHMPTDVPTADYLAAMSFINQLDAEASAALRR